MWHFYNKTWLGAWILRIHVKTFFTYFCYFVWSKLLPMIEIKLSKIELLCQIRMSCVVFETERWYRCSWLRTHTFLIASTGVLRGAWLFSEREAFKTFLIKRFSQHEVTIFFSSKLTPLLLFINISQNLHSDTWVKSGSSSSLTMNTIILYDYGKVASLALVGLFCVYACRLAANWYVSSWQDILLSRVDYLDTTISSARWIVEII